MKDVKSSSGITLNNATYAQPIATISIVRGASSPGITKPYDPSPMYSKGWYISYVDKQRFYFIGRLFDSSLIALAKHANITLTNQALLIIAVLYIHLCTVR